MQVIRIVRLRWVSWITIAVLFLAPESSMIDAFSLCFYSGISRGRIR